MYCLFVPNRYAVWSGVILKEQSTRTTDQIGCLMASFSITVCKCWVYISAIIGWHDLKKKLWITLAQIYQTLNSMFIWVSFRLGLGLVYFPGLSKPLWWPVQITVRYSNPLIIVAIKQRNEQSTSVCSQASSYPKRTRENNKKLNITTFLSVRFYLKFWIWNSHQTPNISLKRVSIKLKTIILIITKFEL